MRGPWLWRSWQSGCFRHQRSPVRIPTSAIFRTYLSVNYNLKKTKIRKKRPESPIKNNEREYRVVAWLLTSWSGYHGSASCRHNVQLMLNYCQKRLITGILVVRVLSQTRNKLNWHKFWSCFVSREHNKYVGHILNWKGFDWIFSPNLVKKPGPDWAESSTANPGRQNEPMMRFGQWWCLSGHSNHLVN